MKFLSWLLLFLTVSMIVAMDVLIVYWTNWPFWTFVTNIAILLLVVVFFLFLKKWLFQVNLNRKKNEKSNLDANENSAIDAELKMLRRDWRNGIGQYSKKSMFSWLMPKQEVPWFLVLGFSNSGKTSLIENSLVAKRIKENSFVKEDATGSHLVKYWGLSRGYIVDVPGTIIEQNNSVSQTIWKSLLMLVRGAERKYSINGVVVCVDVQSLSQFPHDELNAQGKLIRIRLDEIASVLGLSVPIYVMITKCDKIDGLIEFFSFASKKNMTQAFGQLFNRDYIGKKAKYLVSIAFQNVNQSLTTLRIRMLGKFDSSRKNNSCIFFPEEFASIKNSLQIYLEPIFTPNGSMDVPMFRALYFTSAQQDGTKFSASRKRFGIDENKQKQSGGKVSYFIRDIFSIILPSDNNLVRFTHKAVGIKKLVSGVGVLLWLGVFLSVALVLTFGYEKNAEVMVASNTLIKGNPISNTDQSIGIFNIDEMRRSIEDIEAKLDKKWFSNIGLTQTRAVLDEMKVKFVARVKDILLAGEDKYLDRSLELIEDVKTPKLTAAYVDFIVKKIRLLTYAINNNGKNFSMHEIENIEVPDFSVVNQDAMSLSVKDYNLLMLSNYISYIRWQPSLAELRTERDNANSRLEQLYKLEDSSLAWVIDWANNQEKIREVNASDIWKREVKLKNGLPLKVTPAFTTEGLVAINRFLDSIQTAGADHSLFKNKREIFARNYADLYFDAWQRLLEDFERGEDAWSESGKLFELANLMTTDDSPYARCVSIMVENLQSILPLTTAYNIPTPAWVKLLFQLDELQHSLLTAKYKNGNKLDNYAKLAKRKFVKLEKNLRNMSIDPSLEESIGKQRLKVDRAKPYYKEYFATLDELVKVLQDNSTSYDLVKVVFSESNMSVESAKNLIAKNNLNLTKLESILKSRTKTEKLVWKLLGNQTNFMWRLLLSESRKYIQLQWEQDILMTVDGVRDWEMLEKFRGENGSLWKFQEVLAKPFLDRKQTNRYQEKKVYSESLGFSDGFMQSINTQKIIKGTLSSTYAITLSALPTDTNKSALLKPHETKISFKCQNDTQVLINRNYPVSKIINWSPTQCNEIRLNIYIGKVVLEKIYSGARETSTFFSDYKNGSRIFRKDEFGDKRKFLAQYNVDTISVGYIVSGYNSMQKLSGLWGLTLPKKIFSEDVLM